MENDPRLDDFIRAMTPEQKLHAGWKMYKSAWTLKAAWLRDQHPDWSEERVHQEVRYVFMSAKG